MENSKNHVTNLIIDLFDYRLRIKWIKEKNSKQKST